MALNASKPTQVTELTREQVATILTKPLEAASVFLAAGPRIYDTAGPLRIPAGPAPAEPDALSWVGESELIPEHDPTFGELQLLPSTMQSVKVITRYSNELARQAVISLEAALRARLVADVAAKIDAQLLSDQGDGITTPRGLFAYAGVTDTAVGGELTPDVILEAQGRAMASNLDPARMTLFIRPEDYIGVRSIKDADGRYLIAPDVSGTGLVVPILGARAVVSSRIPVGRAALVDMSRIAVARDAAPSVKVLTERYADYDQQALRVVARYDAAPTDAEAVITLSGLTAE